MLNLYKAVLQIKKNCHLKLSTPKCIILNFQLVKSNRQLVKYIFLIFERIKHNLQLVKLFPETCNWKKATRNLIYNSQNEFAAREIA